MKILAIETSCDETAAAVIEVNRGKFKLLSNVVSSQEKIHAKYGGIIPEVAARLHVQQMLPIVETAIKKAKLNWDKIDYIAVTGGPGLVSSLMVGVETAKALAFAYKKPLVRVNHIEGHLLSFFGMSNDQTPSNKSKQLKLPAVALIVSGGHTQIILVKDYLKYKLIGETRDDAAGEAFDKVAKILGLGYPGGPAISREAAKMSNVLPRLASGKAGQTPNPMSKIKLPRPMMNSGDFDMSFSGLKTAVRYLWEDMDTKTRKNKNTKPQIAAEFQNAVIDVLVGKTMKAAEKYKAKSVILGGGVAANKSLREALQIAADEKKVDLHVPEMSLAGDNAAMIGMAAYYHIKNKDFTDPTKLKADPQWELV